MQNNANQTHKQSTVLCIDLLNSFTTLELKKLQKFVDSTYHNSDECLVSLLSFLIKKIIHKVDFDTEHQINTYNKIFLSKKKPMNYTLKEKRQLFEKVTKLTRLAEKFLVFEALVENVGVFNDLLFTKLKEKNQKALLLRNLKKSNKKVKSNEIKNLKYYELEYSNVIHMLQFFYNDTDSFKQIESGFNQLNYYVDIIYILRKTTLYLNFLCTEKVKLKDEHICIELVLTVARQLDYYENANVKANLLAIQLFKTKNDKYYSLLLDLMQNCQTDFSRNEIVAFYTILRNYCITQNSEGINMLKELFNLHQIAEQKDLIIENGYIPTIRLKSNIVVACKTANFQWATSFLNKYKTFIKRNVRKSVYNLNLCIIEFYKENYETALSYAIKVDTVNLDYDKNCKILILKCHFELDKEYDERTLRIFRSAEKYFRGLKLLNKNQKKMYANFMNIFINLYKIKHRVARLSLATIEQRLKDQEINSDKHWLFTKIEELKKYK